MLCHDDQAQVRAKPVNDLQTGYFFTACAGGIARHDSNHNPVPETLQCRLAVAPNKL